MKTIGFLINPVAGMGGSVGLKGTDGLAEEARELGAEPLAGKRAQQALKELKGLDVLFFTCSGEMGAEVLEKAGLRYEVVYEASKHTSAEDTKNASRVFLDKKADLLVFCGGDGTARDIYSVVGDKMPVLGIPAGVKMHSGVFAVNPRKAAEAVEGYVAGRLPLKEAEIMDIDEEAYRNNRVDVRLYGYARVPYEPALVQGRKFSFSAEEDEKSKDNIARFALEFMRDGSLYVVGAGSTTKKIKDLLGVDGTLLGVDLIKDGRIILKDANEKQILEAIQEEPSVKILVGVIGAQGFVFGRGNQQMSARVLEKIGIENIIVVATPHKLENTPYLRVDTGDPKLDGRLSGSRQVVCGYRMAQRKEVLA